MGGPMTRVLIIDDDALVSRVLLAHVTGLGMEGRVTADPQEFLRWNREWRPDFVVVDLVMEWMDGLDVLRHLAEEGCEAAVIISSGVGSRVMDAALRFADANGLTVAGLLPKPYKRADLARLLAAARTTTQGLASTETATGSLAWTDAEFEHEFRAGLDSGQMGVVFQPKLDCGKGEVVGYEVLARWHHPEAGQVPPAVFVPRAERAGLVHMLTARVLWAGLGWFKRYAEGTDQHLSINISAAELADPSLNDDLLAACERAGVSPDRVVLELTETSAMEDPVRSLEVLTRLRLEGFRLSLDDFGTGYSSMEQLARMPFTEIKVDRSFVATLATSAESAIVVRSIVDLARALGLECTAEGVETVEELRALADYGCDNAQGYLLGRPMTAEAIAHWEPPVDVMASARKHRKQG